MPGQGHPRSLSGAQAPACGTVRADRSQHSGSHYRGLHSGSRCRAALRKGLDTPVPAVTLACIEPGTVKVLRIRQVDGQNWESAVAASKMQDL